MSLAIMQAIIMVNMTYDAPAYNAGKALFFLQFPHCIALFVQQYDLLSKEMDLYQTPPLPTDQSLKINLHFHRTHTIIFSCKNWRRWSRKVTRSHYNKELIMEEVFYFYDLKLTALKDQRDLIPFVSFSRRKT